MAVPEWLLQRPIAHRGLHGGDVLENTGSAARAAADRGFAIECDVQLSSDDEAVVFHDFSLERVTHAQGRVDALTAAALGTIAFKRGADRIARLAHFLAVVAG